LNHLKILAFLVLGLNSGCSKNPKPKPWYIDRVQLADRTLKANPALTMESEQLREALLQSFGASRRFVPLAPTTKPRPPELHALRCKLEVLFTRESLDEEKGAPKARAEVGVVMELREPGSEDRTEANGLGRVSFDPVDPAARGPAFRQALEQSLAQAVESELMQLDSLAKSDQELLKDLLSADPRVRDYSVRVLAERKNPAAVPALIEKLKDPDREVAMRAVGALGALGDPRAVAPLIDMSQTRDPKFVVALVDVLATIGGRDAEAYLFTVASGHPDDEVRQAAQAAQDRLKGREAQTGGAGAANPKTPPERKRSD